MIFFAEQNKKIFKKSIDKLKDLWYNKDSQGAMSSKTGVATLW